MKYIDEFDIELVNQALTFDTAETHVQGTCDLFTTKPIGSDRKLYKTLDRLYSTDNNNNTAQQQQLNDDNTKTSRANSDASIDSPSLKPETYISPEFIRLKERSSSYSHPTSKPIPQYLQMQKSEENLVKNRSKSFHSPYMSPPKSLPKTNLEDQIQQFDLNATDDQEININDYSPFGPLSQQSSRRIFAYIIAILNSTYPDHDFSTVQPTSFSLIPSSAELIYRINSLLISSGKSSGLDWIWQAINTHMELDDCSCFQYEPEQAFLNDLPGILWCNMYFIYNKKKKRVAFLYFSATRLQDHNLSGIGNSNGLTQGGKRRNSKIGTLDEELGEFDETQEEYDLRYGEDRGMGVTYEDVFDEDEEDEEAEGVEGDEDEEEGYEHVEEEEEEEEDDEDLVDVHEEQFMANEQQDDDDEVMDMGGGDDVLGDMELE